ncbi:MAG: Flp pilus assembly complex ATPase component TadA, partial [Planctomycetaceae bacterium]|nr:Flp pilus assembly complex ATPase component TadA [Planctomycetaceae bacterium]
MDARGQASTRNCHRSDWPHPIGRWVRLSAVILAIGLAATPAAGQGPPRPGAAIAPAQPNAPAAGNPARSNTAFPPDPLQFQRGNPEAPGSLAYLSLWKMAIILAAFLAWVWLSKWVDEDARGLKVRPPYWNTLVFLGGLAAMLMLLTVPQYAFGLFAGLLSFGVPVGLYINERNQRVPDSSKLLTPQHLRKLAQRHLAKIGIHIGGGGRVEQALGPSIQFVGKSKTGRVDHSTSRQVENSKGYLAAKELVYDAILRRATDIHLEPKEDELGVRLRIDGVMYPTEPFDRAVGDAVTNIFKVLCAMDITERRRAQDGGFGAEMEGRDIDFRVASQGTRDGEKMVIRILDQANSVSRITQLGMRKQLVDDIEELVHQPHGMFLCCGPTGAGKSTTLYACLNEIDSFQKNIITIED